MEAAHIDSVTKCKAHLPKAERAKLGETGRFIAAGNERADELAKEGPRDDSFQSILSDTYKGAVETCEVIISYIDRFSFSERKEERWPDVVAPSQGWDEKDERWNRAKPILACPHVVRHSGRQCFFEACDKRASGVGRLATALGEHARPQCHFLAQTGSFCGAAGVEREQASSRSWACWASEVSRVRTKHPFAVEWLAPQGESLSLQAWARWRQSYQGDECDRAGLAEFRQAVIRLRMAEAQSSNPDDKKHLLLKSGEIK